MPSYPWKILYIISVIFFSAYNYLYSQQQSASVSIEFELAQPQLILNFTIDGTDAGWNLSANETCTIGNVDGRGTPISGAPVGDPNVNGVAGIPVNSTGAPLANFYDAACVGAFYPLFAATGGNNTNNHPSCAICIYIRLFWSGGWTLSSRAQLLSSTANVTLNQLKWKLDATASSGYQNYTSFTAASVQIASGGGGILVTQYLYFDYGLLVENADAPGTNVWLVTYTLTET
jgi:hypothetical protein